MRRMARDTHNIALLIDADNASAAGIDPVLTVLAELGSVNIRRAYGNWAKPGLAKSWGSLVHKYGIEPQQQFDITKGKNATDMKMTIDALDLLYRGHVDGFGIMSSDSDFMPLAMRIRQDGLPVYGFGTTKTPEGFRQACTRFIDVAALIAAEKQPGVAVAPVAVAAAVEAAETTSPSPIAPAVDNTVVDLLGQAWKAAKRDERGFASLSEVGNLAGNRSSFDVRNYGYKRLSDMIATMPEFVTERRETGLWVRRVR